MKIDPSVFSEIEAAANRAPRDGRRTKHDEVWSIAERAVGVIDGPVVLEAEGNGWAGQVDIRPKYALYSIAIDVEEE